MKPKTDAPKPPRLSVRIKARLVAWKFFFNGSFTFKQTCELMLPDERRSSEEVPMTLFGKPFINPHGGGMKGWCSLVSPIICSNQYRIELVHGNVIDAGANVGFFSVFAAHTYPDATIYAFEPAPETYEALKENAKYYPNIKTFNFALGDENVATSIIIGDHSGTNFIGSGGEPVLMKTLDSFTAVNTWESVDFIKMDTEGYEGNIIKGATETIKRWSPIIVMSAYHYPNDKTDLPKFLNEIAPYDCQLRSDCEEDLVCTPIH
jgi:FkbM family methyltransferase